MLRVGSDGSSSDVPVTQWNESQSTVYAPTPGDANNFTSTQMGPKVTLDSVQLITNADTGAVVSWRWSQQGYCALSTDSGCTAYVDASNEYHLTTMTAGGVGGDVVWNAVLPGQYAPVQPVLQLADGTFAGTARGTGGSAAVAFDNTGNVKWTSVGYNPNVATPDGGLIDVNGTTLDNNGNATGQIPNFPVFSWTGNNYQQTNGSVQSVGLPLIAWASNFVPMAGANPSGNATGSSTSGLWTKDVTVIGWIDKTKIIFPQGTVNPTLTSKLQSLGDCSFTLTAFSLGDRSLITSDTDRQWTNAYLLYNSSNDQPPNNLSSLYA